MSENLFRLSATTLSPEPWLATDAAQIDPLTWEITLRTDVTFHNGAAMDAQAVKASLERTLRLSPASAENLGIDSVSVKNAQTITVTTIDPRPTLPGLLTNLQPRRLPTRLRRMPPVRVNFIAAGALTGPYIPTEYILEERLSSVANDDYWGGTPPLAGIEHLAIPDTNSRELALQAGDIDVAINISPTGAQAINSQPGMPQPDRRHRHLRGHVVGQFRARHAGRPAGAPGGGPRHRPGGALRAWSRRREPGLSPNCCSRRTSCPAQE